MSYNYPPRWRHIDPIEALVARFGVENWMVVIRRSALHSRRRDSRDTAIALRGYGTAALALGMKMAEITLGVLSPTPIAATDQKGAALQWAALNCV
jgi:hypothetical protein